MITVISTAYFLMTRTFVGSLTMTGWIVTLGASAITVMVLTVWAGRVEPFTVGAVYDRPRSFPAEAVSWSVYLFAYEYLFRGILLLGLANYIGVPNAIVISVASYLLAHVSSPPIEIAGAVLVAPVFTWMALAERSVVGPFVLHLAIALTVLYLSRRSQAA